MTWDIAHQFFTSLLKKDNDISGEPVSCMHLRYMEYNNQSKSKEQCIL